MICIIILTDKLIKKADGIEFESIANSIRMLINLYIH